MKHNPNIVMGRDLHDLLNRGLIKLLYSKHETFIRFNSIIYKENISH